MTLTGRKVFFITAGAFAVIIGVNVTMAVLAVGTFPGLEVKNSYVASQSFDAKIGRHRKRSAGTFEADVSKTVCFDHRVHEPAGSGYRG